jgi:hypothetical protein
MNPTVYDRSRVSQKLAATRGAWDGQTGVNGAALPDPFTPSAKLAAALKLSSWKVIAGGMAGLVLASGAYVAFPSASSSPRPAVSAVPQVAVVEKAVPVHAGFGEPRAQEQQQRVEPRQLAKGEPSEVASEAGHARASTPRSRSQTRSAVAPRAAGKLRAKPREERRESGSIEGTERFDPASEALSGEPLRANTAGGRPTQAIEAETDPGAEPARAEATESAPLAPTPAPVAAETPAAPKPPLDPMIEDLSLLKRAAEVLHRGDARSAQSILREHARRFPASDARLERHALAFAAACAMGDTKSADEHRATLMRDAPHSALSARVRAGCGKSQP